MYVKLVSSALLMWAIIIIYEGCLYCCHPGRAILKLHSVHVINTERRQAAADIWTKPTHLNQKPANKQLINFIHHYYSYSFIIPQKVEGRVNLCGWLCTEIVHPFVDGYPSWVTSLTHALPLSQNCHKIKSRKIKSRPSAVRNSQWSR